MNRIVFFSFCIIGAIKINAQMPMASSGTIKHHESFQSKFVTARNVYVLLSEGYTPNNKYNVLYMHHGQMLFDIAITWNHQAWEIDEVIEKLTIKGKIKDVIVVGIWNGGATRHPDYFPQKLYESLPQIQKDTVTAQLQRAGVEKKSGCAITIFAG